MTDNEESDSDFSDSESDYTPEPIKSLEHSTQPSGDAKKLAMQLEDVQTQFRHLKQEFGRVLTQKEELQRIVDTKDAGLQLTKPTTPTESQERQLTDSRGDTQTPETQPKKNHSVSDERTKRAIKQSKQQLKEAALLANFQDWIPFATSKQFQTLQILHSRSSSPDADQPAPDQTHKLVDETIRRLLSWGCFIDSPKLGNSRTSFLYQLVDTLAIGFIVSYGVRFVPGFNKSRKPAIV